MAYNKSFNPDALPAHAEPEQAAQTMGGSQKPLPRPSQQAMPPSRQHIPGDRRPSPAAHAAQQAYRPPNLQTQNTYTPTYDQHPDQRYGQSSPPPVGYGHAQAQGQRHRPQQPGHAGLPLQQALHTPQQTMHTPQRTMPPPDADSEDLYPLFGRANISGTGALTTSELGSALVNADFTPFDPHTVQSLMRMFSTSSPNSPQGPVVIFTEFQGLWRFLNSWRVLFERFDEDASGRISLGEFTNALIAFGYRLSQPFVELLYRTFNDRATDRRGSSRGGMSFDLFVQACIRLKRMTDVFKAYDDDRDGFVTLSFEEFLSEMLKLQQE